MRICSIFLAVLLCITSTAFAVSLTSDIEVKGGLRTVPGNNLNLTVNVEDEDSIASVEIIDTNITVDKTFYEDSDASPTKASRRLYIRNFPTPSTTIKEDDFYFTIEVVDGLAFKTQKRFTINVITRQELVNMYRKAAHTKWSQRVGFDHPTDGILFGYSGNATIVPDDWRLENGVDPTPAYFDDPNLPVPTDPNEKAYRWYASDWGWCPEPKTFVEHEDSVGHPGVAFGFLCAYEASKQLMHAADANYDDGDLFYKRVCKELGKTLISQQNALNNGGWWYDMGLYGFNRFRDPNGQTTPNWCKVLKFNQWINQFPWAGHANYQDPFQDISCFDGISQLGGYYQLRLAMALPASDPDRIKFFRSAKWLADTIIEFKDVYDEEGQFYPYGPTGRGPIPNGGGVPQVFPYDVLKSRGVGVDESAGYEEALLEHGFPKCYPSNVMPTGNDAALLRVVHFQIAFWEMVDQNPELLTQAGPSKSGKVYEPNDYLESVFYNAQYTCDLQRINADPNGYGGWGAEYWFNDGSDKAGFPCFARGTEGPGRFWLTKSFMPETLIKVYILADQLEREGRYVEKTQHIKSEIQKAIKGWAIWSYFKIPPVNDPNDQEMIDALRFYGEAFPASTAKVEKWINNFNPNDRRTYIYWEQVNMNPEWGSLYAPAYTRDYITYYGPDVWMTLGSRKLTHPASWTNSGPIGQAGSVLIDKTDPNTGIDIWHGNNDRHDTTVAYQFGADTETNIFGKWGLGGYVGTQQAINMWIPDRGYFYMKSLTRNGITYETSNDDQFCWRIRQVAWAVNNLVEGEILDQDGDGVNDEDEIRAGTNYRDSSSFPVNQPTILMIYGAEPAPDSFVDKKAVYAGRAGQKVNVTFLTKCLSQPVETMTVEGLETIPGGLQPGVINFSAYKKEWGGYLMLKTFYMTAPAGEQTYTVIFTATIGETRKQDVITLEFKD